MDPQKLINSALQTLKTFLEERLRSSFSHENKTASLLAYWLKDYVRMLRRERSSAYRRFQRGDIVKVHFGFRIGSEHGGLHYAIVLNPYDSPKSPVITVIPLTSLKSPDQVNRLHFGEVFLGAQLLRKLYAKLDENANDALASEISRLKWGSIALTNQITTISKVRIYDPINRDSPLRGVRLDSEAMDQVDAALKKFLFRPE